MLMAWKRWALGFSRACVLVLACVAVAGCLSQGGEVQYPSNATAPIGRVALAAYADDSDGARAVREWLHDECGSLDFANTKQCLEDAGMECSPPVGAIVCTFRGVIRSRELSFLLHVPLEETASPWRQTVTNIKLSYSGTGQFEIDFQRSQSPERAPEATGEARGR